MRIKKVGTMKLVLGKESDQCHRPRLPAHSLIYRYCHTAPCPVLYPAYHPLSSWASQLVLQTMPKCNLSTLKSTKTCSTPPSPSSEKNNLQLVHQASPSDCPPSPCLNSSNNIRNSHVWGWGWQGEQLWHSEYRTVNKEHWIFIRHWSQG